MELSVSFMQVEFRHRDISDAAVIVLDVFRASTSIVAALSAGAKAVYPYLDVDEARAAAKARRGAILGGERHGIKVEGFDLGNSPSDFSKSVVSGRDLVMTTTNGTRLLSAAAGAREVFVAGFVNASATAAEVSKRTENLIIAAAGTEGYFSIEDALCAGLMVTLIGEKARPRERDSATFARLAYASASRNLRGAVDNGRGATNIKAAGLEPDIDMCLAIDSMPIVAALLQDPLRVVRADAAQG